MTPALGSGRALLHGAVAFLSAFLAFLLQPIVGRAVLPWFGGGAGVWTACMVFFQADLLLGYLYAALLLTRLGPRRGTVVHLCVLGLAVACLPITPDPSWKPPGEAWPPLRILALLASSVGLPFAVLAATAPLVQAWEASAPASAGSPWRLYAVSNAGSLLGLLVHPLAVDPLLDVPQQARAWSAGFALFALACAIATLRAARTTPPAVPARDDAGPPPPLALRALWLGLSATAVTLLLSVTAQMCQEVAVVPFLWVLPLAVYLVTWILCFAHERCYPRGFLLRALLPALGAIDLCLGLGGKLGVGTNVALLAVGLWVLCMVCHGELYRLRPGPARLSGYYLTIAAGGVLGGLFVGVAAPLLFAIPFEAQAGMAACAALAVLAARQRPGSPASPLHSPLGAWAAPATAAALLVFFAMQVGEVRGMYLAVERDFHGVHKVMDRPLAGGGVERVLVHGITEHGRQRLADSERREPRGYYARSTGIGWALGPSAGPRRVGVIGLGAGVLAAYGRHGDEFRFYELSPAVERAARGHFTYLADCPARLTLRLGDGRLSLEREPEERFDVLAVDAFSSDAVPVHLLTREALELYRRHLRPGGRLLLHLSNRSFALELVAAATAESAGLAAWLLTNEGRPEDGVLPADWVLIAEPGSPPADLPADARRIREGREGLRPWTDAYSNPFGALR